MSHSGLSTCIVCRSTTLEPVPGGELLPGVTSDTRPWPRLGSVLSCSVCQHTQKQLDRDWQRDVDAIYSGYHIYPVSSGAEQVVFRGGMPVARSARLLERLAKEVFIPEEGTLLDMGCGNGALLRSFARIRPGWTLAGCELDSRYRDDVEAIPGVREFWAGLPDPPQESFDLITLLHVLEHVPEPVSFLRDLATRLRPGGRVLVQVPHFAENPFDLAVRDHCSHFQPGPLLRAAREAGLAPVILATQWIGKEITLLLQRPTNERIEPAPAASQNEHSTVEGACLSWLGSVLKHAAAASQHRTFGIFGTATAGTWLGGALGDQVSFYVDEDVTRVGKTHLGRPVITPTAIPSEARVYMALPYPMVQEIAERFRAEQPGADVLQPPIARWLSTRGESA